MTLTISLAGLALSVIALAWSRVGARRTLLHELHTSFINQDRALQRHALHAAYREHGSEWPTLVDGSDRAQINLGLAHLDHLAFHAMRRYVSPRDAQTLWARAIHECRERGDSWITERRANEVPELWVFLDQFCAKYPDPRKKQ